MRAQTGPDARPAPHQYTPLAEPPGPDNDAATQGRQATNQKVWRRADRIPHHHHLSFFEITAAFRFPSWIAIVHSVGPCCRHELQPLIHTWTGPDRRTQLTGGHCSLLLRAVVYAGQTQGPRLLRCAVRGAA